MVRPVFLVLIKEFCHGEAASGHGCHAVELRAGRREHTAPPHKCWVRIGIGYDVEDLHRFTARVPDGEQLQAVVVLIERQAVAVEGG
jgi:hypothetical protein